MLDHSFVILLNMRKIIQRMLALFLLLFFLPLLSFAQDYFEHVVKKGETLSSIASYYKVSEETLKNENPILESYFYAGVKIRIPIIHEEKKSAKENDVKAVSQSDENSSRLSNDEKQPKVAAVNNQYSKKASEKKVRENKRKKAMPTNTPLFSLGAFFIPISGGFGLGAELSDIVGIPIGLGVSYWKSSYETGPISVSGVEMDGGSASLNSISVFLTYCQRFYLKSSRLYLTPKSGLELDIPHYSINDSVSANKVNVGLRFNPTVGYQFIEGFSVECGFLGTLYNLKSFGCNMTLGIAYRF